MSSAFSFNFEHDDVDSDAGHASIANLPPATEKGQQTRYTKPQLHSLEDLVCLLDLGSTSLYRVKLDDVVPCPKLSSIV